MRRFSTETGRVEAFSDGVFAVIITIMVLELRPPTGTALLSLKETLPSIATYALSFVFIGIYWNNHHHMFQMCERVTGTILWANLNLLFWLSLLPFATGWMGENHFARLPTAAYGCVLLAAALSYTILQTTIVRRPEGARLAAAVGGDRKGKASIALYVAAIAASFLVQWLAAALYAAVALMWLVPDRRIESRLG
jgi:uncharacterized membrane protein